MAIAVDVGSRKEIERMAGVVPNDGRELEPGERHVFPGTLEHCGDGEFMPLVEVGQSALKAQVGVVLGTEVTVEVGGSVERFAVRVIPYQREVVAETLLHLQDAALVERRSLRRVLVGLE